jgi:hypothetical protein
MQASPPLPAGLAPEHLARVRADIDRRVDELIQIFREQLRRALGVELDLSVISLAYVDHYLTLARAEQREPILTLLAAGAGVYFGELVRRAIGGHWLGATDDPRALILGVEPALITFSPFAVALEAIVGDSLGLDDPRLPPGYHHDPGLHFPGAALSRATATAPADDERQAEVDWLQEHLAELAPVSADHFYSLTCRLETLQLIIELLAGRQEQRGSEPRAYTYEDYLYHLRSPPPAAPGSAKNR